MKIFATLWGTGKAFVLDQAVNYQGTAYICTTAHTAGASFDSGKFRLLDPYADDYYDPIRDSFYRENFFAVDLVYIELPDDTGTVTSSSVLRLTTGGIDVDVGGYTYTAQGDFMGFSAVTEEFDVKVGKFGIHLSGLGSGMIDRFMDKDFEGKRVAIYKAFLDYQTLDLLNEPYPVFDGIVYNVSITESAVTCTIQVDCSTLWADFERTSGRMTNNQSNWRFQLGSQYDVCFEKAGTVGNVEYKWGRA